VNRASSGSIPFNDLARGVDVNGDAVRAALERVVTSGWYVLGPEHDAFERELAAYVGVSKALGVASGTDALQFAMAAVGVGPGDVILTAANAGGYATTAARALGAEPLFADVDPRSLLLSAATISAAIATAGSAPRAVVVTHLYGAAAPIQEIVAWARPRGIRVIEDCAQSLGAVIGGVRAGAVGDVAATSFYPTKNLGALGDGGAVLTSDEAIATRVEALRQYGWKGKYRVTVRGGRNSRLDEIQAAVLRVKLPHLDEVNERRRAIHRIYEDAIGGSARLVNTSGESFVGHLAVIEVERRDEVRELFAARGIATDVHYPIPDHAQPIETAPNHRQLPVTEAAARRVLSIPLFPELRPDEVDRIASALGEM